MRNTVPNLDAYMSMGAYLSPGRLIGNLRYSLINFHGISIPKQNPELSKKKFHCSAAKWWYEILLQIRNSPKILRSKEN